MSTEKEPTALSSGEGNPKIFRTLPQRDEEETQDIQRDWTPEEERKLVSILAILRD